MKEIFKANKEFLENLLPNFKMAVKSQYCRNVSKEEFDKLTDIYFQLTGSKLIGHYGCSRCIYNIVKSVGELYLNEIRESEQSSGNTQPSKGRISKKTDKRAVNKQI